jgi:preprotein translocase subunit YajC
METLPLLFLLIALGAFMFLASRRQKKAMQATINLHESLHEGDRIHTTSGLQGTIVGITDDSVDLEIAPGVVTRWMKLAIRDRIDPAEDDDSTEDDDISEYDATDSTAATEITESTGTFGTTGTAEGDISSNPDRR